MQGHETQMRKFSVRRRMWRPSGSVCFHGPRSSHNSIRLHPRGAVPRTEGVFLPKLIPELLKGGAVGIGGVAGLMKVLENRAWALGSIISSSSQTLELWRIFALRLYIPFTISFEYILISLLKPMLPFIKCGRWAWGTLLCETKGNSM